MTQTRTYPMHPELRHLTHLSYYVIGGGQPKGRTELWHPRARGTSPLQQASDIVLQVLERAKQQHRATNA